MDLHLETDLTQDDDGDLVLNEVVIRYDGDLVLKATNKAAWQDFFEFVQATDRQLSTTHWSS